MTKRTAGTYHHGELRDALVSAALDLLEREGVAALSLRALARKVGVSPMAPYHHFKDREALLAAVATVGFQRLQESKARNEEAHENIRETIAAGAANYVRFVLENPNLYRLMRGPEFDELAKYPELRDAMAAPAETLVRLIERLFDEYGLEGHSAEVSSRMLWGLAHGIGTLALDGQLPRQSAPSMARDGAAAMVEGWLSQQQG